MKTVIVITFLLHLVASSALSQTFLRDCPEQQNKEQLDSCCGNYGNNLPIDTLNGPYPEMHFQTYWASLSPDGRYLASKVILVDWDTQRYWDGFIIVDTWTHLIIKYRNGAAVPRYSPDGKLILTTSYVYDPSNNNVYLFPPAPEGASYTIGEWSKDGKYIYMGSSVGLFRWTAMGDSIKLIHSGSLAVPLTNDTLIYIRIQPDDSNSIGYEIIDIQTESHFFVRVREWDSLKTIANISVAPDGRMIAFDFSYSDGNRFNDRHGLCIFDRWTKRMKTILPAQAFRNRYYPRWTNQGTLIISYACRKDSSYTVWEVDTNGVFLRQLTDRSIFNQTSVDIKSEPLPTSVTITGVYPLPSRGRINVTYSFQIPGLYTIAVMDVLGRVRATMDKTESCPSTNGSVAIQSSDLSPGLYVIKICSKDGVQATKTIIVER